METTCPQCSQRLRVSDELRNPLLRCRRCEHVFRLADAERYGRPTTATEFAPLRPLEDSRRSSSKDEIYQASAVEKPSVPEEMPDIDTHRPHVSRRTSPLNKGGWGTVALIVFLLLVKVGPRLLRNLFRERPPAVAPVQRNDAEAREVQRLFQKLEREKAKSRNRRFGEEGAPRPLEPADPPAPEEF